MNGKSIQIAGISIGNASSFTIIAGPCVIESEEMTFEIASALKEITARLKIPFIFKASFDKANRTSIKSFRGPGMEEGLTVLAKIRRELAIPVLTDIHEPWQAKPVSAVVDMLQIPAFLCRQTDLLVATARTGLPVNIKKAQFLAPTDMQNVVVKMEQAGNTNLVLCERGTMFGYNNLVVDMTSIVDMKKLGYPVVFDATHSVQKPGGNKTSSGGDREYVEYLARAALAVGADGIFMEVHPEPERAKSDGPNMVYLDRVEAMLKRLIKVYEAAR